MNTKHYRLAIYLAAYDPYKDLFDIFISQFDKCWPDCPYPLIISNMYFENERKNTIVIHNGNIPDPVIRKNRALESIDADYYLGMEEDRIFNGMVDTKEVEKILDFMDKESIDYYRCNASIFPKRKKDKYVGYDHAFHIPMNEPYGVCGSTVIMSKQLHDYRKKTGLDNGYKWEAFWLKKAGISSNKWIPKFATDNRNLFHIVHCVEKQKWIASSRRLFIKKGYEIDPNVRKVQGIKETIFMHLKQSSKLLPAKSRIVIKKVATKMGFEFVTDY